MTTIFFDLDGTLANLYAVEKWLEYLRSFNPLPYRVAKPIGNFKLIARQLNELQANGYRIGVITWLSKESTPEYDEAVRAEKRRWLAHHLPSVVFDEVHMVKYGTSKNRFLHTQKDILFDDTEAIRKNWKGEAYKPEEINTVLGQLLK